MFLWGNRILNFRWSHPPKKRKMDHNPIFPLNPIRGKRTGFRDAKSLILRREK